MPQTKIFDIDLDALDRDGICAAQTPSGASNLTLNGALGATLDYARIIGIYSGGDVSNRTFTINGTNANGETISQASITGPNAGTVVSSKLFKTITSIAISGAAAAAVEVGNVQTTLSAEDICYPLNYRASRAPRYVVDVTGTINYTIYESFGDLASADSQVWLALSAHSAKTADTNADGTPGAKAMKVVINSYSDTAELQCYVNQTNGP